MTSNAHKWLTGTVSLSEERYHHKRCPVVGNYSIWLIQHYHVIVLFILSRFQNLVETKSQARINWPSSPKILLIQAACDKHPFCEQACSGSQLIPLSGTEALIISWSLVIFYLILFLWTLVLIYSHVINLGNQKSEIIEESFQEKVIVT